MPLVLLAVERWRRTRRTRTLGSRRSGALLVCWLQPWQGGTLALIVRRHRGARAGGARGERPAACVLAVPAAAWLPARLLRVLLGAPTPRGSWPASPTPPAARPPGAGPGGRSCSPLRAARAARRARLPPAGARLAGARGAGVAVRRAGRLPGSPSARSRTTRSRGWRSRSSILAVQGVVTRLAAPAAGWSWSRARAHDRARHRPQVRGRGQQRSAPPATRTSSSPASSGRSTALEADPRPGGVLAPAYAGHMIPYRTGREVYVGALSWTPDWDGARARDAGAVRGRHAGRAGAGARAPLGARFVFVDCRPGPARPAAAARAADRARAHRFGCATLYVLRRQ